MTASKWTARILGGALCFVAALWATAPAQANDELNGLALCAVYGKLAEAPKADYEAYINELLVAADYNDLHIGLAVGYAKGYLKAISHVSRQPQKVLAEQIYDEQCKMEVL